LGTKTVAIAQEIARVWIVALMIVAEVLVAVIVQLLALMDIDLVEAAALEIPEAHASTVVASELVAVEEDLVEAAVVAKKLFYIEQNNLIKGINMKKFLMLTTLALGMATGMQAANATTTDELLQYCKTDSTTNVTCQIYGQAVYDTYLATRNPKTAPSKICVKQPAPTRIQVVDEYIAWANADPANGPKPAAETMLRFLEGVFPCKK
jgi:hypothetical protein